MQPTLSVIICTHNPRDDYLAKVLAALKLQTLPTEQWELLLVDNASQEQLCLKTDLQWHPQAKCLREERLGLTHARIRGIREAKADLLVFVDDDNVLDPHYLATARQISQEYPNIGVWGGRIEAEFEEPPADWTKPYWGFLGIRDFDRDSWANFPYHNESTPCGAGMCVRKAVGEKYIELVLGEPKRLDLDRKGNLLSSCGDSDIAYTACDLNLGTGQFVALKLTHLIPSGRLHESYLLKLVEGTFQSGTILAYLRGIELDTTQSWKDRLRSAYRYQRLSPIERKVERARKRGRELAIAELYPS